MDFFKYFLKDYWTYCLILLLTVLLIVSTGYIFLELNESNNQIIKEEIALTETEAEIKEDIFYVDIKGAVKKPGVYEVNSSNIINDVIKLAGGLSKSAYTKNINLSKKLESEMVINVFTKSEYKKLNAKEVEVPVCQSTTYVIDNCTEEGSSVITTNNEIPSTNENVSDSNNSELSNNVEETPKEIELVSINTATVEELMTLNGIGETKANNIVEYRTKNGLFNSIEEIKNVSGIGESAFEKIKDNIKL